MPRSDRQQSSLTSFFTGDESSKKRARTDETKVVTPHSHHWKRQHSISSSSAPAPPKNHKSRFGTCPICGSSLPWYKLESHAAECTGGNALQSSLEVASTASSSVTPPAKASNKDDLPFHPVDSNYQATTLGGRSTHAKNPYSATANKKNKANPQVLLSSENKLSLHPLLVPPKKPTTETMQGFIERPRIGLQFLSSQPLPQKNDFPRGLYMVPDFLTLTEERQILHYLDDPTAAPAWKMGRFNGQHCGKRWGVHCNLRDRRVDTPEHPLPEWLQSMILSKLQRLDCWAELAKQKRRRQLNTSGNNEDTEYVFTPNEANAIDYRRQRGDWLRAHVDDRKLSTEPIANLSLVGDSTMTFRNTKKSVSGDGNNEYKVPLPRRGLQILTGPARYNYTHAIANADLHSDRRVSITMRESPLTRTMSAEGQTVPKIDSHYFSKSSAEQIDV
jgi:alkylated DNA repair dioxygenase AlkB